jgi:hypothetical protein
VSASASAPTRRPATLTYTIVDERSPDTSHSRRRIDSGCVDLDTRLSLEQLRRADNNAANAVDLAHHALAGQGAKAACGARVQPRRCRLALASMPRASECSEPFSADAHRSSRRALASSSSSDGTTALVRSTPALTDTAQIATTRSSPRVIVPVLSNSTSVTRCSRSSDSPFFSSSPWRAATPAATTTTVGAASATAHGHETTSSAIAKRIANTAGCTFGLHLDQRRAVDEREPNAKHDQRQHHDDWHKPARDLVGEQLHRRLGVLRVAHQLHNLRHRRLLHARLGAHHHAAVDVARAANQLRVDLLGLWARLARHHRLVDRRRAAHHDAVDRHAIARHQTQQVAGIDQSASRSFDRCRRRRRRRAWRSAPAGRECCAAPGPSCAWRASRASDRSQSAPAELPASQSTSRRAHSRRRRPQPARQSMRWCCKRMRSWSTASRGNPC